MRGRNSVLQKKNLPARSAPARHFSHRGNRIRVGAQRESRDDGIEAFAGKIYSQNIPDDNLDRKRCPRSRFFRPCGARRRKLDRGNPAHLPSRKERKVNPGTAGQIEDLSSGVREQRLATSKKEWSSQDSVNDEAHRYAFPPKSALTLSFTGGCVMKSFATKPTSFSPSSRS